MTSDVLKATLELLDQTALADWKRLAKECNLNVAWIRQLINNEIAEPGINKTEKLFKALGGKWSDL